MSEVLVPKEFVLERIRLRQPRVANAEGIFDYCSDPEVAYYMSWSVRSDIDSLIKSLREREAVWDGGSEFAWVVALFDGQVIGGVSCKLVGHSAEIGFLLNRRYWGHGYATEASRALVEWASTVPSITRVWASCDTENEASIRVMEKLGLTREETLPGAAIRPLISSEPRDVFIYSRPAASLQSTR